jgi:hypothetical protein
MGLVRKKNNWEEIARVLAQIKNNTNNNFPSNLVPVILVHTIYENGTECSETSAHNIQRPGNCPKGITQHSQHDEKFEIR